MLFMGFTGAAGKSAEQLELYRQAVAHDVLFYDAYETLGNLALREGHIEAAVRMFERAVAANPVSAEGYASLGSAYCASGQMKQAIPLLNQALKIDPNNRRRAQ